MITRHIAHTTFLAQDICRILNFEHPVLVVNTSLAATLAKVDLWTKCAFETISDNRIIGLGQDVVICCVIEPITAWAEMQRVAGINVCFVMRGFR